MAKTRALVKRRKAVRNIRKITRTMELIATARFKKALDRATEAEAFTRKIAELAADLGADRPARSRTRCWRRARRSRKSLLLVLTRNRGLCGGYNGSILREATGTHPTSCTAEGVTRRPRGRPASGGSPSSGSAGSPPTQTYTQFEDKPAFDEVERPGEPLHRHVHRRRDRPGRRGVHEVPQRARQQAGRRDAAAAVVAWRSSRRRQAKPRGPTSRRRGRRSSTSSCPTPRSILEEIVPVVVQGPAVQVLPRRGGQRADRPPWSP